MTFGTALTVTPEFGDRPSIEFVPQGGTVCWGDHGYRPLEFGIRVVAGSATQLHVTVAVDGSNPSGKQVLSIGGVEHGLTEGGTYTFALDQLSADESGIYPVKLVLQESVSLDAYLEFWLTDAGGSAVFLPVQVGPSDQGGCITLPGGPAAPSGEDGL